MGDSFSGRLLSYLQRMIFTKSVIDTLWEKLFKQCTQCYKFSIWNVETNVSFLYEKNSHQKNSILAQILNKSGPTLGGRDGVTISPVNRNNPSHSLVSVCSYMCICVCFFQVVYYVWAAVQQKNLYSRHYPPTWQMSYVYKTNSQWWVSQRFLLLSASVASIGSIGISWTNRNNSSLPQEPSFKAM